MAIMGVNLSASNEKDLVEDKGRASVAVNNVLGVNIGGRRRGARRGVDHMREEGDEFVSPLVLIVNGKWVDWASSWAAAWAVAGLWWPAGKPGKLPLLFSFLFFLIFYFVLFSIFCLEINLNSVLLAGFLLY
jgi:hypothetical protein